MNPNSGRKKWVITIVIAAILIAAAVAVAILAGPGPDEPVIEQPKESPLGVYYYDTAEGEYLLTLSQGNVFMISGPSLNKSGKCVVNDDGIELDFVKDEDGTGSLKEENGVMVLQYKDKTMRFLEKKTFKVNFNVNGGSEVAAIDVTNGKTVSKPADPTKDGSVFIGWYADEACTELYGFGNEVITADTTVYAKWAETVVGQNEYMVNFELGYEAEGYEAMSTIGGKLYNVPVPARDGYTFAGWWVSQTQNAEQLTIPYVEDMVFQANTTLFALWTTAPEGGKLAAPMVEVYADSIKWNTIQGASAYQLTIIDAAGTVIHDGKLGATTENFDFATREAGEYTIQVTALASVEDKNSETTTRTFVNKALDRVSLFTVIDGGILLWNGVEGAEKYLITIDCGNDAHKHTAFDNGDSTTFMFKNCAMQEGGIKFTVTAVADGKASSVSETFVYDRKLDAVGEILYNEETQSFYWDAVANAAKYSITVKAGGKTFTIDNGSATTFSAKYLSGDITLEIIPMTQGYNSPEATTTTYKKTSLATPEGLMAKGNILTWNAVEGATGYMVKINNQSFQAETNSLDLNTTTLTLDSSTTYDISVMAVGTESSLYSDVVTMKYLAPIESVTYKNNTVTWTPVMGVENYEVRVNGGEAITVSGANTTKVVLTKAGINTIEVRYTDLGGSIWTSTEVFAYEVIYNSRSLSGTKSEFLAIGDTMTLPQDFTQDGYDFTGWYNAPEAADGLGGAITDTQFSHSGSVILYANWTPKTFYVTFEGVDGITNIAKGDQQAVTYKDGYVLPIPEADDEMGEFMGWYTGPGGSGIVLTDAKGNSLTNYDYTRNAVVYPAFNNGVLTYILQADGTYAVTAGPKISDATTITVPEYYKDIPVTTVLDNAFANINTIEKILLPGTIRTIGVGAIPTTNKNLKEITVYTDTIQQNYEVFYSSYDGALLRHDMGTIFLEFFPRGKTGEYTIPDNVNVIRDKAFRYAQISKLTVGNSITNIARHAFYECSSLKTLEFKGEGTLALSIDDEAFYRTANITTLRLPARLAEINLQIFDQFSRLSTVEIEAGGEHFSTAHNLICNAVGDTILYAPKSFSGEYTIPLGIRAVGPNAFKGSTGLRKLTVPNYVNSIGASAFAGCTGITEVVVMGSRSNDLLIDQKAFYGCTGVTAVTFQGGNTSVTTIGTSAFEGNKKLKTLTFESGTNVIIGDRAFALNESMESPAYMDGSVIQTIGAQAYIGCTAMKEAVIPATTLSVGDGAFSGCASIEKVTFQPNGQNVTFGSNVFADCRKLTTITLPATLGAFDGSVFDGCDAIASIVVEDGNENFVTHDGALYTTGYEELVFYPRALSGDMTKLHPNLKRIGASVFKGNSKIVDAFIGKNIVFIGDGAFMDCFNLKSVTFEEGGTAMTIGASAFANCSKLTAITLPAYTAYIGDSAFEAAQLKTFAIPEATTYLGHKALMGNTFDTIVIPANVEFIGDACFANVPLKNLSFIEGDKPLQLGTLENNNTSTGKNNGVFIGTKLENVTLADRVTIVGGYAFYKITTLKTVTISEKGRLEHIGDSAFRDNSNLTSITFGACLKTIGKTAFNNDKKLTAISLPNTVESLGGSAFLSCSGIKEVYFAPGGTAPLDLDTISNFGSCSALTKLTLPARMRTAYADAATRYFASNFNMSNKLATIEIEPGSDSFAVINNVLYELNPNGEPEALLFCAPAMTGELVVPKEVRYVAYYAFYYSQLKKITFEDYPEGHENYGQPLLEIGVEDVYSNCFYLCSALTRLELPSHLKLLGQSSLSGLSNASVSIVFHKDAHLRMIDEKAFNNSKMKSIDLPRVDYIDISAFEGCTNLESVTFHPESTFTEIMDRMFYGCSVLKAIAIPDSVTVIGKNAFTNCKKLAQVTFSENCKVTTIYDYAFRATALTEFVMPESVDYVDEYVFRDCASLTTVTLNKKLSYVNGTLVMDSGVTAIHVPAENPFLKSIDGVVYDVAETILYVYPAAKDPTGFVLPNTLIELDRYSLYQFPGTELVLPETLETIGKYAVSQAKIKRIHIPKNVKLIDEYAFVGESATVGYLEEITFAEDSKLETIGKYAFQFGRMRVVALPDGVKTLAQYAFAECPMLEEVTLPAAIDILNSYTFNKCNSLRKLVMQEGLQKISANVFMAASGYNVSLEELNIPASVEEIANSAFANMHKLEKVTFAEGSKLKKLGSYAFQNCIALESITLPSKLATLSTTSQTKTAQGSSYKVSVGGAFQGCTGLKHVDMSACTSLKTIPTRMFGDCFSLETLILPPKLTTIADYAFGDVLSHLYDYDFDRPITKVKELTIPATVTSIGAYAFYGFEGLETVTFETGSKMKNLGAMSLTSEGNLCNQYIFANTPNLKTVVLPEELTTIGLGCFENSGVTNIEIPATVTGIGDKAFKNCDNLVNVTFPLEMRTLGDEAFYDCDKLEAAALPGDLEKLGALAFALCEQLKEAFIPAGITMLGGSPYAGCSGLTQFVLSEDNSDFVLDENGILYDKTMYTLIHYPTTLTAETYEFPASVHEIGMGAFAGAQLKTMVIPDRIRAIPQNAFTESALESITFHGGISSVGDYAFAGCKNLNNVTILNNIKYLGHYAFANCTGLSNFTFEDINAGTDPYTIGMHFFDGCTSMTEVVLPNKLSLTDEEYNIWKTLRRSRTNAVPSYMFANTGIVNAVLPEWVTDTLTEGVFYGCKDMQTFEFAAETLKGKSLGPKWFYDCSSLKEIVIPNGLERAFVLNTDPTMRRYDMSIFANCTSLEKVTINTTDVKNCYVGVNTFYNCSSLTTFVMNGGFSYFYQDAFYGCTSLKAVPLGSSNKNFFGQPFGNSGVEALTVSGTVSFYDYTFGGSAFDGTSALKQVFLSGKTFNNMCAYTFSNVASEMTVYFTAMTYDEVVAKVGNDAWFKNADKKVTFYFKDTMPEGVEIPQ